MKKVFSVPLILAVGVAISALIGFPVGATEAIIIAVAAFAAAVRVYSERGLRLIWSREVWAYITAAVLIALPSAAWLVDFMPFLGDLIDAIVNFNVEKIITVILLIANFFFRTFMSKKTDDYRTELQDEKEAGSTLGDA